MRPRVFTRGIRPRDARRDPRRLTSMRPRVFTRGIFLGRRKARRLTNCFNEAARLHARNLLPTPKDQEKAGRFNEAARLHARNQSEAPSRKAALVASMRPRVFTRGIKESGGQKAQDQIRFNEAARLHAR